VAEERRPASAEHVPHRDLLAEPVGPGDRAHAQLEDPLREGLGNGTISELVGLLSALHDVEEIFPVDRAVVERDDHLAQDRVHLCPADAVEAAQRLSDRGPQLVVGGLVTALDLDVGKPAVRADITPVTRETSRARGPWSNSVDRSSGRVCSWFSDGS